MKKKLVAMMLIVAMAVLSLSGCGNKEQMDTSEETKVSTEGDVKVLYCLNPECLAKKIKAFSLFVSRDAMNMEGLSEATMEK